jgi:hypothetical protein
MDSLANFIVMLKADVMIARQTIAAVLLEVRATESLVLRYPHHFMATLIHNLMMQYPGMLHLPLCHSPQASMTQISPHAHQNDTEKDTDNDFT